MNIITVIPLTKSKVAETLSYFTSEDMPVGAVVTVPLRSKTIHAIVVDKKPAQDLKGDIRSAPFQIRKLNKVKATAFFPIPFIESCNRLSDFYASTVGAVIHSVISDSILENIGKIPPALPMQASFISMVPDSGAGQRSAAAGSDVHAVQGDDEDRTSSWRSLIRQEFARKKSIAIYAPTIEDARNLFAAMEKGIEGYIFLLHGNLAPKKAAELWTAIANTEHPVVVVATGSFSVLPRSDIGSIVIERENNRGWISQRAPYIDLRHALETIALKQKQTVYRADSLLSIETLQRLNGQKAVEASPFKWRSVSTAADTLVDMSVKRDGSPGFKIISEPLEELLRVNREENAHTFLLAVRRGVSPMTVCDDCGAIVTCSQCSAPVVLYTSKETGKNYFMCHKCGERRGADETCKVCGGWRLTPLGIGIDRVYEEIRKIFPDYDLIKIDADTTKTYKKIQDSLEKFKSKPGSALIGTELALLHLAEKVDHVAVVSLDSLFALPDYRIQEKIMYSLIRLRSVAARSILVQTRRPEEKVFEYGLKGNLSDFYRDALAERKRFKFPPFATLIKITLEGEKEAIAKQMSDIQKTLEPHEIDIFPAFTSTVRGNYVIHGLLKADPLRWPDMEIVAKLRSLPPGASVRINPESLL